MRKGYLCYSKQNAFCIFSARLSLLAKMSSHLLSFVHVNIYQIPKALYWGFEIYGRTKLQCAHTL